MTKNLKLLAIAFCIALVCSILPRRGRADEWDRTTTLTFSGPVQVANTQLPAGTYVFKLADTMDRHIVQIFNADATHVIATIIANPDYRLEPADSTVIKFAESSGDYSMSGTVPASGIPIKEWFYPGDNAGVEFRVAPQLAAVAQPAPVVEAPPAATAEPTEAVPAVNPPPAETSSEAAPPAEPPAPQAQTETVPATSPEQSQKTDPAPEELPKTASPMPLIGLVGLVSIGLGVSLRMLTKRTA